MSNHKPAAFTSPVTLSNIISSVQLPHSSLSSFTSNPTSLRHVRRYPKTASCTIRSNLSSQNSRPDFPDSDSEHYIPDSTIPINDDLTSVTSPTTDDETDDEATVRDTDFEERQRRQDILSVTNTRTADIPIPPEPTVVEIEISKDRILRLETGRMARQAAGAVAAKIGNTMVFCTACVDNQCSPTVDFLPLRVDYAEKFSATGKTAGSYVKREGRPSEREVLISRLIDRPLRPMFEDGFFNEVQVLANVFSYDGTFPADALAICGASAALHISNIPLVEPVAGVRLAYTLNRQNEYEFIVEPTTEELKRPNVKAELVIAGCRKGILMIEGHCNFVATEIVIEGIKAAHKSIIKICDGIDKLRELTGSKEKMLAQLRKVPLPLRNKMLEVSENLKLDQALSVIGKKDRDKQVQGLRDQVFSQFSDDNDAINDLFGDEETKNNEDIKKTILKLAWKELVSERMRNRIIDSGIRPDGRDVYTVRPISIDLSPLPNAHGSALFTRGETQTLAVSTLGGDEMAQRFETLEGEDAARFYLQYSFPPFSVGEVGRLGPAGRREIGHGKLAERALMAVIPPQTEFPYVLRVESNILESNGSSSMASVCGGCLALLDAGVPLKSSVAGVAMGLVIDKRKRPRTQVSETETDEKEDGDEKAVVLTDILGLEDALGSCDAKFAGNRQGWTALQLDVKLRGISINLLGSLLNQASDGLGQVLDAMDAIMPLPNPTLPSSVPKVLVVNIPQKRIGEIIGPGGKTIKSIIDRCGGDEVMKISVDNDGRVSLTSDDETMLQRGKDIVESYNTSLNVGMIMDGKITKILPFGAFVEILGGKEGWMHISEMDTKRTENVEDLFAVGDAVQVKLTETGRNGQYKVSRKALLQDKNRLSKDRPVSTPGSSPPSPSSSTSSISSSSSPSSDGTESPGKKQIHDDKEILTKD